MTMSLIMKQFVPFQLYSLPGLHQEKTLRFLRAYPQTSLTFADSPLSNTKIADLMLRAYLEFNNNALSYCI